MIGSLIDVTVVIVRILEVLMHIDRLISLEDVDHIQVYDGVVRESGIMQSIVELTDYEILIVSSRSTSSLSMVVKSLKIVIIIDGVLEMHKISVVVTVFNSKHHVVISIDY